MRRLALLAALVLATVLLAAPGAGAVVGQSTTFSTGLPAGGAPQSIAVGPDGNLWFTLPGANAIGRITPTGQVAVFTAGISPNAEPWGITAGPDGNLWFTARQGNTIGRITPAGQVTEFPIPTAASAPWGIAAGPDGNLWFTQSQPTANRIGRITPLGQITEFTYALGGSDQPLGITAGPDGNLWFVERGANAIVRMDTQGQVLGAFSAGISAGAGLTGIAAGPDGNLWFTEQAGNRVGRITPAGVVTEFPIAVAGMAPTGIVAGADGALWVTEYGSTGTGASLVRVTTAGVMAQYGTSAGAGPVGIASGPDGNLWFADATGNRIGRMLSGAVPVATAAPQIVGSAVVGTSLSATTGSWTRLPTAYRYRWLRCTTAAATKCSTVSGRTGSTYLLGAADQGRFLKVSVTAVNLNGDSRPQGSATTAQIPSSAFTLSRAGARYRARDVLVTTTIRVPGAGRVTQVGTTFSGGRTVRRCRVSRSLPTAGSFALTCRLLYGSRATLRRTPLRLTVATIFQVTGGAQVTKRQTLWLPKRVYPFRPVR